MARDTARRIGNLLTGLLWACAGLFLVVIVLLALIIAGVL
jgi:preprotein translocase subunit SecG